MKGNGIVIQSLFVLLALSSFTVTGQPAAARVGGEQASEPLRVVGVAPLEGEVLEKRILFFFDEALDASAVATGELVSLTPQLHPTCTVHGNALSITARWPMDTKITVYLNPALQSVSGRKLATDQPTYTFYTSALTLKSLSFSTPGDESRLNVVMSYPVAPEQLAAHLYIVDANDKAVVYEMADSQPNTVFSLLLKQPPQWPVRYTLYQGLTSSSGNLKTENDIRGIYPKQRSLRMEQVNWGAFKPERQEIRLRFSQAVHGAKLKQQVFLTDLVRGAAIPFQLDEDKKSRTHTLLFELYDSTEARVSVVVAAGLLSEAGGVLSKRFTQNLERIPPRFSINNMYLNFRNDGLQQVQVYPSNFQASELSIDELPNYITITPPVDDPQITYGRYNNEIQIRGVFRSHTEYTVTFKAGMPYHMGHTLQQDVSRVIETHTIPAYIGFEDGKLFHYPRRSGMALSLRSRDMTQAKVYVYRLLPQNLQVALADLRKGNGSPQLLHRWSELVAERIVDLRQEPNTISTTQVALDELLPEQRRGVFCLAVSQVDREVNDFEGYYSSTSQWDSRYKVVQMSDIAALAHWEADGAYLFAHDLYSIDPLREAQVSLYSGKNQLLQQRFTNENGIVHLRGFNAHHGKPVLAVVEHGDDFTYLELTPRQDDLSAMSKVTDPYAFDQYDAYLYADRDMYRPGETVHLRWLAREGNGDALAEVPLLLEIERPDQKTLHSTTIKTSVFGTAGFDLQTEEAHPTGRYTAKLYVPGKQRMLAYYHFQVKAFVPNRIKTEVLVPEPIWRPGEAAQVQVHTEHLFGAPASGRKCDGWVYLEKTVHTFPEWPAYRFGNADTYAGERIALGTATSDQAGNAAFTFRYTPKKPLTSPMTARIFGEVFEMGGRSVTGQNKAVFFPSERCLGLALSSDTVGEVKVDVLAVDPTGKPVAVDKVRVSLERRVWNYYTRRYYSNLESRWAQRYQEQEAQEIVLASGQGSASFSIPYWGDFRIRVAAEGMEQFSTQAFYSYSGQPRLSEGGAPNLVRLTLDKDRYLLGEKAQLRIEAPFDGMAVVVVQGAKLHAMSLVEVKDKVGHCVLAVEEFHAPNVWLEVTMVHEVDEGNIQVYPYAAFGITNLNVENPKRKLKLAFQELPDVLRPDATATFRIQVTDSTGAPVQGELTLAAVDEGIHGISNYVSPAPYPWFNRSRRPVYQRAHFYDRIAYDYEKIAPGGGFADAMAKRVVPPLENWIKPVALWSGVVNTDDQGMASIGMKLPEFNGQLRLVTVAADETGTGATEAKVFVRRDYMLRTSMPRFLLPDDTAQCRAVLFNQTDAPCSATLQWRTEGALVVEEGSQTVSLAATAETTMPVPIRAGDVTGQGVLHWQAEFRDADGLPLETVRETAPLPVNAPAVFQSDAKSYIVKAGESMTIANERFSENAFFMMQVSASAHPMQGLLKALRDVTSYPYGCVEQTTSRCMPMFVLRKYDALVGEVLPKEKNIDAYLQAGIDRLFAMQTNDGGLAYWPGGDRSSAYGSVYALHFLTQVKREHAFDLPLQHFKALQRYAERIVRQENGSASDYYLRAYALYVLALDGDAKALDQIQRFDTVAMPRCARLMLAAAIAQNTQDVAKAQFYLGDKPEMPWEVARDDATFGSSIRNEAVELLALTQLQADPQTIAQKADRLFRFLRNEQYSTTQENAFVLMALHAWLESVTDDAESFTEALVEDGAGRHTLTGASDYKRVLHKKSEAIRINNTATTPVFVDVLMQGIPREAEMAALSEGITLQREFYTESGEKVETAVLEQGSAYIVQLTVRASESLPYPVIVDLLPAGLEIQDNRIEADQLPKALTAPKNQPDYTDARDDRIVFSFDSLRRGEHVIYYTVRAVTPGAFQHPAADAECMYQPQVHGNTAVGHVQVITNTAIAGAA